ncbi:MAG TPA: hydroxyquinol 1,2-dioxygenase [Actinomycetota bacterium]|nr:hydroxyquinol 1,2-dioxygenase [Actinomycetota bacterium]
MTDHPTVFGSIDAFEKGTMEVIDDDPKRYTYSNMFEVASISKPYEKVAVARNMEYVLEVLRAEGTSGWRSAPHDEFALVMDGEVEVELVKLADVSIVPEDKEGSVALAGEPEGTPMGRVVARRGHMTLLPKGAAYRFDAKQPGVIMMQTIAGEDTVYKWSEICQTIT